MCLCLLVLWLGLSICLSDACICVLYLFVCVCLSYGLAYLCPSDPSVCMSIYCIYLSAVSVHMYVYMSVCPSHDVIQDEPCVCPCSGGHFNPAVSVSAFMIGGLNVYLLLPYILAQLCGGMIGAGLAMVSMGHHHVIN